MKKHLFFLITAFISIGSIKSQCSVTTTASLIVSTTTVVNSTSGFCIKICSTGTVYDTTGNPGRMYYIETGGKLYIKMNSTTMVYMKPGSFITKLSGTASPVIIYNEVGANITGTFSPPPTTCSVVSYPASPSCVTGITENNLVNLITVYPNPAKNYLTINNESNIELNAQIINAIGQTIKSIKIDSEKKTIDVAELGSGIYFLNLMDKDRLIGVKKLIIEK